MQNFHVYEQAFNRPNIMFLVKEKTIKIFDQIKDEILTNFKER